VIHWFCSDDFEAILVVFVDFQSISRSEAMENIAYEAGQHVRLYMNLYKAGWFHRLGKPGTVDLHPGDFYLSAEKAQADVDRPELYVGTVGFDFIVPEGMMLVENAADSEPVPLSVSRRRHVVEMKAKGIDITKEFANAEVAAAMSKATV
jgi:hypothetical protein